MTVEVFWVAFCCLCFCLSVANRQSAPKMSPTLLLVHRALWVGDVVAIVTVGFFYPLLLLMTGRFWSATLIGLGLIVLLWAGNHLKKTILNESLVFSDVFLAGHALRYPRLYFGYVPRWIWPLLILIVALGLFGVTLETPDIAFNNLERWGLIGGILVSMVGIGWLLSRPSQVFKRILSFISLSFDAPTDIWAYTPLGAALLHLLWHGQNRERIKKKFTYSPQLIPEKGGNNKNLQHRFLIQAESFVPLHQLVDRPSCMPMIDQLLHQKRAGRIKLAWRGAYTMRTEFAVLTGIAPRELETYAFDPYRLAAMIPMKSLAWDMKARGFRTVVCHPNDGRFFNRFRVMQNLGFDEFIDLHGLMERWPEMATEKAHCGRYINDEALIQWATKYLKASTEPTFLFVITMEAHGPWDRAKFTGAELLTEEERYEIHLGHLDSGISALMKEQMMGLDVSVLLYGDHLPGLQIIRRANPTLPSETCWIAWNSRVNAVGLTDHQPIGPENLAQRWNELS